LKVISGTNGFIVYISNIQHMCEVNYDSRTSSLCEQSFKFDRKHCYMILSAIC